MKDFEISKEALKKVSKMDADQLKAFMQNIYNKGFSDGNTDVSGISVGALLGQIEQVQGVGPKILKEIAKIVNDLLEEEKIWKECVEREKKEKR